uniref:Gypsy retrotransposon integrase-like protein 1 n=1 Tax=Cyprinus carpio carpio TaxID=630221 RepID=A0A9J7ZHH2_CYPCA
MLEGLEGTLCHADDILVFGATHKEHDARLLKVLNRLEQNGLTLNEKCEFAVPQVRFLGHIISAEGIRADPDKIKAIKQMPEPKSVADVKRFLGMVNYIGKFSPNIAELTGPIRDLLKAENDWTWGIQQQQAFEKVKQELSSPAVLAQYCPDRQTRVSADASFFGLGGVLSQLQPAGEWRPVAFISRSMTPTEKRYAQIEKEALAITWACERFQTYLLGLDFVVRTDHKPLVSLLGSRLLDDLPPRILRFRLRLLRFSFKIMHVAGKNLITADTLSRAPLEENPSEADLKREEEVKVCVDHVIQQLPATPTKLAQIKKAQEDDEVCRQLSSLVRTGWEEKKTAPPHLALFWQYRHDLLIAEGLLMKGNRLVIPGSLQKDVLERVHQGHQGITKCLARAQMSVWWPGITRQIKEKVSQCETCVKNSYSHPEPLLTTLLPSRPWQRVAADLFHWNKGNYILLIDYYSRYIEVASLTVTTTKQVMEKLKAMFARHGVPEILVTDNGPQFAASDFADFAKDYDFHHVTSSPHYPQSNGEAERAVRTVKTLLKKGEDPHKALMAYRATPLASGASPAQLLMGRNIRTTLPVSPSTLKPAWPNLNTFERKENELKAKQKMWYNKRHRAQIKPVLRTGQSVWIKNVPNPGRVTCPADTPRSYIVEGPTGSLRRHRSHLRVVPSQPQEIQECVKSRVGRVIRPPLRLNL